MKIIKILYQIILITILIVMCSSCICFAAKKENLPPLPEDATVTGDESIGLPDLNNGYKPTTDLGGTGEEIVGKILGVAIAIGGIAGVISIALIGFNTILGSASEKAANQEKYIGVLVGAILITSGSIIARIIMSFADKI